MLVAHCPDCEQPIELVLTPARIETRTTHPELCGNQDTHDAITARELSWNCTNTECDQRDGKPTLQDHWKKQQKEQRKRLKKLLKKMDAYHDTGECYQDSHAAHEELRKELKKLTTLEGE